MNINILRNGKCFINSMCKLSNIIITRDCLVWIDRCKNTLEEQITKKKTGRLNETGQPIIV